MAIISRARTCGSSSAKEAKKYVIKSNMRIKRYPLRGKTLNEIFTGKAFLPVTKGNDPFELERLGKQFVIKHTRYLFKDGEFKRALKHFGKESTLTYNARHFMKNRCFSCGGVLPSFGHWRKNGADHPDWCERYYHKSCYKRDFDRNIEDDFIKRKTQSDDQSCCDDNVKDGRKDGRKEGKKRKLSTMTKNDSDGNDGDDGDGDDGDDERSEKGDIIIQRLKAIRQSFIQSRRSFNNVDVQQKEQDFHQ